MLWNFNATHRDYSKPVKWHQKNTFNFELGREKIDAFFYTTLACENKKEYKV